MAWVFLVIAGIFEIVWAWCLKHANGSADPGTFVILLVAMAASFGFLSLAMRTIPIGAAYAVWTGIGTVGVSLVGSIILGERITPMGSLAIILIIIGVVLLKLSIGVSR